MRGMNVPCQARRASQTENIVMCRWGVYFMHKYANMREESSGRANADNAPHSLPHAHANAVAATQSEKHAREKRLAPSATWAILWSCAVFCASTPRRSIMRLQLDSSRTASGPALLARGSAARQSRPSRRTAVETPALRRVKRRRRICVARNAASPMRSYEAPPAPRRMSRRAQPRAGGWNGREERRE